MRCKLKIAAAFAQVLVVWFSMLLRRGTCCDHGWLRYGDHCFRIHPELNTRNMARLRCLMQGSDLASISDESTLQYITVHTTEVRGDRFWVGLQRNYDDGKLKWLDGNSHPDDEPWVHVPPRNGSFRIQVIEPIRDCYAFNGAVVLKVPCYERIGSICGHKRANATNSATNNAACYLGFHVAVPHSFVGEVTGRCLFRASGTATQDKTEELCQEDGGHFLDLDGIMKDGMTAFYEHQVLTNDGSHYWTGLKWNGTNVLWSSGYILQEELSIPLIRGSGSCITVQFNFTDVLETHLYQTECSTQAKVVCLRPDHPLSTTPELPLMDEPQLSCPSGYNWKSDRISGYCYWETSFETEKLSWSEAERYCQSYGGHLGSFHSVDEEKIGLSFQYGSMVHPYWIGLNLDVDTGIYKWSDGSSLDYTNWAPGHPNHMDKRLRCVAMEAKDKHWVSSLCGILSWFICKAPKMANPLTPVLPTATPLKPCADTFGESQIYYYEGSCYFSVSDQFRWHRAKQYCEDQGASLVSIHSDEEVGFLLRLLYESTVDGNRVWIGLNSLANDGSFRWTDWSPVDFTYFNKDEPNNYQNQEKCCNMYTGNGLWNDENCNAAMGFVCKRRNDTTSSTVLPSTPDPRIGNCKQGWVAHNDRCYFLGGMKEKDRVNWTEALQICHDYGGYITSVRDEKDQAFLAYLLQTLRVDAWIGLHDTIQSGRYYWLDNSDLQYTNWAPGEPSFFGVMEDCVMMVYNNQDSGVWKDEECERKLAYICQNRKDTTLPEPAYSRGINCLQPEGWLKLDNMCFKMFAGIDVTWDEAESACKKEGAHLVSVHDKAVKAAVSYMATEVNKSFWIGLQYKESSQTFSWLNGWPMTLSNWEKNEPGFLRDRTCFAATAEGYWKKLSCEEETAFLCQISTGKPMKLKQYTGSCPSTSKLWAPGSGSFCYILDKNFRSDWFTSNLGCFRYGSHLVSIHSMDEIESLRTLMNPSYRSVFIGLVRNSKGGFVWTDDSPVNFVNWAEGEPTNNGDHCVEMIADTMKWKVSPCVVKKHFVCQDTKDTLVDGTPENAKFTDEASVGLSATALTAIVLCAVFVISLILVAVLFYKRSSGRNRFRIPFRQQSVSFENALYNVDSSSMEFHDERKSSL